jgi:hypothetical protein
MFHALTIALARVEASASAAIRKQVCDRAQCAAAVLDVLLTAQVRRSSGPLL